MSTYWIYDLLYSQWEQEDALRKYAQVQSEYLGHLYTQRKEYLIQNASDKSTANIQNTFSKKVKDFSQYGSYLATATTLTCAATSIFTAGTALSAYLLTTSALNISHFAISTLGGYNKIASKLTSSKEMEERIAAKMQISASVLMAILTLPMGVSSLIKSGVEVEPAKKVLEVLRKGSSIAQLSTSTVGNYYDAKETLLNGKLLSGEQKLTRNKGLIDRTNQSMQTTLKSEESSFSLASNVVKSYAQEMQLIGQTA